MVIHGTLLTQLHVHPVSVATYTAALPPLAGTLTLVGLTVNVQVGAPADTVTSPAAENTAPNDSLFTSSRNVNGPREAGAVTVQVLTDDPFGVIVPKS
jgi:hypothetical protein